MKKGLKKVIAVASAVTMLGGAVGALAACNNNSDEPWKGKEVIPDPGNQTVTQITESPFDENDDPSNFTNNGEIFAKTSGDPVTDYNTSVTKTVDEKQGTYRTFTASIPSLWNALDSVDENNNQIMNYISSQFFDFDYKFDEEKGGKFNADGTINQDAIIDGAYEVKFSAATKLEDVTDQVTGNLAYTDKEKEVGGYAWKLTLRDDLKWDDGTVIKAEDFVYSMQQQLSPEYRFRRASSYYGAVSVKGAREYSYQGQTVWQSSRDLYGTYETADHSKMVFSLASPTENKSAFGSAECYMRTAMGFPDSYTAEACAAYIINSGVEATAAELAAMEGKTLEQIEADAALTATWEACLDWWQTEPNEELDFFISKHEYPALTYDGNVGVYADGEYGVVVCYTGSKAFLKEDGSLSYLAAYELSDLPLVKKALFESCKVEAGEGQTLATNKYQTSVATSASWGPYKLATHQAGDSYKLVKNDNWYGYALKDNTNQYNVTAIECKKMETTETQWMAFLSGAVDDIGIDVTHAADYRNSKYAKFTPGTYTFSWHLYSGLEELKQSGRNNTVLAIDDFRKGLSLAIDRKAYAQANSTAYTGAYGYLNDMYYYDVENGGVYRQTDEAKTGLLRAYGYVENEDKTWSLPTNPLITNKTIDEAYETLTGYNIELAKEYVEKAYERLTKYWVYYQYNEKKPIQIKFGTAVDNDSTRREYNYIKESVLTPLFAGTSFEGKVELVFDASFGNDWDTKFLAGEYELCTSAWGSAAFNPHYFIGAYVDPQNAYTASYWDTETVTMTMTVPGEVGDFPGAGKVRTMTIMNWYRCLNGYTPVEGDKYTYDWGVGKIKAEYRNEILAKLEETVLTQYYSIPTITQNSATLLGAKFSYASDEYNTFMGYGGMRYLKINYTDTEWEAYVNSQGGNLETEYKSSAD